MKRIEQRKLKLEVMEMAIEALERAGENHFQWERTYWGYDESDIENWTEEKKEGYERLTFKEAVLQEFINYIENTKV